MVIERLELDLDIRSLHDLIDFPILFTTDELAMFICQLNLEADFVMEILMEGTMSVSRKQAIDYSKDQRIIPLPHQVPRPWQQRCELRVPIHAFQNTLSCTQSPHQKGRRCP